MRIRIKSGLLVGSCLALVLFGFATRSYWLEALADGLVCTGPTEKSDVIVIENLDNIYLLFERAARLHQDGMGGPVIVPVAATVDPTKPGLVALRIAEVMCQVARISDPTIMPVTEKEPYSIGLAQQVAARLQADKVSSVIIVTAGFRSRRTYLIYRRVLSPLGIRFSVSPVFGNYRPDNWTKSWHGVMDVVVQLVKLQYYRWVVL